MTSSSVTPRTGAPWLFTFGFLLLLGLTASSGEPLFAAEEASRKGVESWAGDSRTRAERPEKGSWASREPVGAGSAKGLPVAKGLPADECEWSSSFGFGGLNGPVFAQTVFDDGGGEALYVGGDFSIAGGVHVYGIAKWDGTAWSALGSGMDDVVFALATFDDGSGEALYAGGYFTDAGGVAAYGIAKWDGTAWSALGIGVDDSVFALTVFDDGGGEALFAGGYFSDAGGVPASNIAKWDGTAWSALGLGVDEEVDALTVFDDGGGDALYAGGFFEFAGGAPADYIAMWDGTTWSPLGLGTSAAVFALAVFDDGGGDALFAAGFFEFAGGASVFGIAKWDGATWSDLGGGLGAPALSLTVFDDGGGEALYVGGFFFFAGSGPTPASGIAKWNGTAWSALGAGVRGDFEGFSVDSLGVFDDGGGAALFAGGVFFEAGDVPASFLASWDGTTWSGVLSSGPDFKGMDGPVFVLQVFDDGGGPALYAGGAFGFAGDAPAFGIAKWDGASWSALGSGMSCLGFPDEGEGGKGIILPPMGCEFPTVEAMVVYDDGGGPALYVGGGFDFAGGVPAPNIAKWDGASWSALGFGTDALVEALAVYDDDDGPDLYVGGEFDFVDGGLLAPKIARWDGAAWSTLGSGMDYDVEALAVYDDGGGADLYVGGEFDYADGVEAHYIARWDGAAFSALGSGMDDEVETLVVYDDGGGPDLYAGGQFDTAGGVAATSIARWDGGAWSAVGSGVSSGARFRTIDALVAFDDGDGPDLYAGGFFDMAGGVPADNIARWDGASWSALGSGVNEEIETLAVFNVNGPSLYAGGFFDVAGGFDSTYFGEWRCPAAEVSIDDVTLAEGDVGTTDFVFTVSRTHNATDVAVDFVTADGSANAGVDYTALPLQTLNFTAGGMLSLTVTVAVTADTLEEPLSEDFFVDLSNPAAATLSDDQGVGSILDDDDDGGAPAVTGVDSTVGTGDGVLAECEEARVAVTRLQVTFDQSMYDPAGDAGADDVTNPDNYRLFASGMDRDVTSATCGPPSGDDVLVAVDAVLYDDGAQTATLELAGGSALADGPYRLVVCDSITDPAGNALAGDFTRTFRVERDNLFVNGHFDCDLGGWTPMSTDPGEIAYIGDDIDAASISGSAAVTNLTSSTQFSLGQCLPASGGASFELNGSARLTAAAGVTVLLTRTCEFFTVAGCAGEPLSATVDALPLSDTAGVWQPVASGFTAPGAAASMFCAFDFVAPGGETFSGRLDDLELLGLSLSIFADGFESGNITAWSTSSP